MVAIFKLIASAALLSSASAAALPVTTTALPIKTTTIVNSVVQTNGANVLAVGDPVLAVRPAKVVNNKKVVSRATSTSNVAASLTIAPISVEATGVLGKLIVGEPVLAIRLDDDSPVASAIPTTLITSVRNAVPTALVHA